MIIFHSGHTFEFYNITDKFCERERVGGVRERDEESMRKRDRWGSEWVREGGRLLKRKR